MNTVTIQVNNKNLTVEKDARLLDVLNAHEYDIPALCYHPDFKQEENCRLCLVDVDGKVVMSCSVKTKDGMVVTTDTDKIKKLRKTNADLLLSNYAKKDLCIPNTTLCKIAKQCGVDIPTYTPRKENRTSFSFGDILTFDMTKCVDCRNCIKACAAQSINAITVNNYGYKEEIAMNKGRICIYCGQCLAHCPAKAISTNPKTLTDVNTLLNNKKRIKVAQIAPSVRVSIGEIFGLPYGAVATDKLVGALKEAGFDYVFDTSFASDITTVEEAKELVTRIQKHERLPMLTSCCPGWVRYLGLYYKDLLPLLTSVHSPQIIMGNLIKMYFSKKIGVPKEQISVVSLMPCIAKKWECLRFDYAVDGVRQVDHVLTTVEAGELLQKRGVNMTKSKPSQFDNPLGEASGAGVMYGASGGVMVSALRTAYFYLTGKNPKNLEFSKMTEFSGYKEMKVSAPGLNLRVAAIDGLGNFEKLYKNLSSYDYIEVMACQGGCIGGGGQPTPVNDQIRKKRANALLSLDVHAKNRLAHENLIVKQIYKEYLKNEEIIRKVCHYHPT